MEPAQLSTRSTQLFASRNHPSAPHELVIAKIHSCLEHSLRNQPTSLVFTTSPQLPLSQSDPSGRQQVLRALVSSLSHEEIDHAALCQYRYDRGEELGQILSDLLDARRCWEYRCHRTDQIPPRMKLSTAPQIVQTFKNLYSQGYRDEARQYLTSYQEAFPGLLQYWNAYFQTALYCLQRGDISTALCICEGVQQDKVAQIKRQVLDTCLNAVPSNIDPLIPFARSLRNERVKMNYMLQCAAHLINLKSYDKAFEILQAKFDTLFVQLFDVSLDWEAAYDFACWLDDSALRLRCLQICKEYINPGERLSLKQLECLRLEDVRRELEVNRTIAWTPGKRQRSE